MLWSYKKEGCKSPPFCICKIDGPLVALFLFWYNSMVRNPELPIIWIGSSKKDLMSLPVLVRRFFGHALHFAQNGERHDSAKALKGFGSAGVLEVVEDDADGTYRAVYTVRFQEQSLFCIVFRRRARAESATPKKDMETIRLRLKAAEVIAKETRNDKTRR